MIAESAAAAISRALLRREFSREDRLDGAERDAGFVETRLPRRDSLQAESGEEEGAGEALGRGFDGEPELHRQRERENDDGGRRVDGRREGPDALECERDREHKGCEVRAAPRREARRSHGTAPGLGEAALLGGGDRAVLGTVERERPAAQEPNDEADGDRQPGDQLTALRR